MQSDLRYILHIGIREQRFVKLKINRLKLLYDIFSGGEMPGREAGEVSDCMAGSTDTRSADRWCMAFKWVRGM